MGTTAVGRNRDLFGACAGALLQFLVVSMSGLLVPLMALDLGATPQRIGVLLSVSNVGALIAAVPSGMLVSRYGTRAMVVASSVIACLSCLYIYLWPSMTSLLVGLTVFGIGWTVFAVAAQCHIGAIGGEGNSNSNFGWYGTSVAVGQMVGPLVSGILIDTTGTTLAWLVMAIGMFAVGVGLYFVLDPGMMGGQGAPSAGPTKRPRLSELFNVATTIGILSSFVIIFATAARGSFFPVFLDHHGFSASLIGAVDSVRGLTSVFARASIGPALRLLKGRFSLLIVCQLVLAVGLMAIPLCLSLPLLVLNAVVIGIGFGVAVPINQAIVFDTAPPEHRGISMGIRMTGNRVGQMVSPLLFGLMINGYDTSASFVASGVVLVLMTAPMIWLWVRGLRVDGKAPAF
jgi:MFS family permease